jgi:4-amino-4-deoxy-L-arabinose transferase-like glycosyltransferase
MTATEPSTPRGEWLIVFAITVVGALIRFWSFGQLGLTHFDEGIYALGGLWSVAPGGLSDLDPQVIPYSPPGFPLLVGLAYVVLGVADTSALFVAVLCGVLTIPVAAWVGRRTFGPGAGAAAAAFAALSLAHVAFSRKALTDSPFLLAWLVAIGLGSRFLEAPRIGRAIAFGLAVGIAQNFKYNGWIAGAVILAAALFGLLIDREARSRRALAATFALGALAMLVAALIYSPWYVFVERHGGYTGLIHHHRGYVGGPRTWFPHWRQQLAQVVALSGGPWWGALTWTAASLLCGVALEGAGLFHRPRRGEGVRPALSWLLGCAFLALIPDAAWWAGLAWAGWLVVDSRPYRRVLASWWLILSLMTPFYHPYARLWLPLDAAGWLLMAGVVVQFGPWSHRLLGEPAPGPNAQRGLALARALPALVCLLVAREHWGPHPPRPFPLAMFYAPTDGFRRAAAELVKSPRFPAGQGVGVTIRVLARRPVLFYLALHGVNNLQLLPDANGILEGPGPRRDWVLVDDALFEHVPSTVNNDGILSWSSLYPRRIDEDPRLDEVARLWRPAERAWIAWDPITLLDTRPEAAYPAFELEEGRVDRLILLAPSDAALKFWSR